MTILEDNRYIAENFYQQYTQRELLANETGEIELDLGVAPLSNYGWLVLEPTSSANREEIFYHRKLGTSIFFYDVNRTGAKGHNNGSLITLSNSAGIYNFKEKDNDNIYFHYKTSSNDIEILGGKITDKYGVDFVLDNTNTSTLALTNDALNYVYVTSTDGGLTYHFASTTTYDDELFIVKEIVKSALGVIVTIEQGRQSWDGISTNGGIGRGIDSFTRTSGDGTAGSTDVYTIEYTDDTTTLFTIYNGVNGTGTVNTLIAGTNISIDSTDATQPIITATVDTTLQAEVTLNTAKITYPSTDSTKLSGIEANAQVNTGINSGTNTGDNSANTNSGLVHTTGAETIGGVKTFSDNILTPQLIITGGNNLQILSQTTNIFFKDGTGSAKMLFRNSANSDKMTLDLATGNLGIGTTSPNEKLEVNGDIKLNGNIKAEHLGGNSYTVLKLSQHNTSTGYHDFHFLPDYVKSGDASSTVAVQYGYNSDIDKYQWLSNASGSNTELLTINCNTTNVGIGTTSPSEKLTVAGNILGGNMLAEGTMTNGQIVTSVSSGNLTVALKTKNGTDPSATDPVYVVIDNVVRTISGALSVSPGAGGNWCNSGSSELATKEIDFFTYLLWNTVSSAVQIGFARISNGITIADFSGTGSNEKYFTDFITSALSTDKVVNIGRFNATLSAAFAWSIPATSIIINRPVYETRWLSIAPVITWAGTAPTSINGGGRHKYKLVGDKVNIAYMERYNTAGTTNVNCKLTLPFSAAFGNMGGYGNISNGNNPNPSMGLYNWVGAQYIYITCNSISATQCNSNSSYEI